MKAGLLVKSLLDGDSVVYSVNAINVMGAMISFTSQTHSKCHPDKRSCPESLRER